MRSVTPRRLRGKTTDLIGKISAANHGTSCNSARLSSYSLCRCYPTRSLGVSVKLLLMSAMAVTAMVPVQKASAQAWADPLAGRMLLVHNRERAMLGVPAMVWDPQLARSAASYGPALAAAGRLVHSPRASRPGQRENLAMAPRGSMIPEGLAGMWVAEKKSFVPGVFPAVSRTGSWLDVAHYTQMVWRTTSRFGCALYSSGRWDYLICRYSPPGNADGRRVF